MIVGGLVVTGCSILFFAMPFFLSMVMGSDGFMKSPFAGLLMWLYQISLFGFFIGPGLIIYGMVTRHKNKSQGAGPMAPGQPQGGSKNSTVMYGLITLAVATVCFFLSGIFHGNIMVLLYMVAIVGFLVGPVIMIIGAVSKKKVAQVTQDGRVTYTAQTTKIKFLFSKIFGGTIILTIIFVGAVTQGFANWSENGSAGALWLLILIMPLYPILAIATGIELINAFVKFLMNKK